jgi:hypothetical protein
MESQMSIVLKNKDIYEEVIDMDEKLGLVSGYIVIRKRLTMTLKEYLAKNSDLSPVLKAYLKQ